MVFDKYSKIEGIHKNSNVLDHEVVIHEKMHGTSARFGWTGGKFKIGSRNNVIATYDWHEMGETRVLMRESYKEQFDGFGFHALVMDNVLVSKLPQDTVFYGELFGGNVQKGVTYGEKSFACFDVKVLDEYLSCDPARKLATEHGLEFVPELFRGTLTGEEVVEKFGTLDSTWAREHGGESLAEGVVIKPILETRDHRGNRLIVKFKTEKYTEKKVRVPKSKHDSDAYNSGVEWCTEARVENAIDKVRQEVNEPLTMQNTPLVLEFYSRELAIDARDVLPEEKKDRKEFMKGGSAKVVFFYRKWLAI